MIDIKDTLNERQLTHGDFRDNARITRALLKALNWYDDETLWEEHTHWAMGNICYKLSRIVSGNPHFHDHWFDIVGYVDKGLPTEDLYSNRDLQDWEFLKDRDLVFGKLCYALELNNPQPPFSESSKAMVAVQQIASSLSRLPFYKGKCLPHFATIRSVAQDMEIWLQGWEDKE